MGAVPRNAALHEGATALSVFDTESFSLERPEERGRSGAPGKLYSVRSALSSQCSPSSLSMSHAAALERLTPQLRA